MIYYTKLNHLSKKAQKYYGCKYILQIRIKNPCTDYISPETRIKLNSLIEAKKYQKKYINITDPDAGIY